jgi:ATPase subunit of ABC transporter with duplicated ATPase domains
VPASLSVRQLSLSLGDRHILVDVDLDLSPGQRVGLVGPNGVGKSTLLRVIAGRQRPDRGAVVCTPPSATVGYLDQEPPRSAENAEAFVRRRTGVTDAQVELDTATADLAALSAGAAERYDTALQRWLALGAADFDTRIGEVWHELGIADRVRELPMDALSGGQAARVGLAAAMLSSFDIVLLDEPTNDLDLDGLRRLEQWVLAARQPVVVVSHDREFLRRTVTDVAELDQFTHALAVFGGGYEAYLHERQVAAEQAQRAWEEYDAKRSSLAQRAQREREWASQGLSRAKRRPDDNDKFIRSFKINQTEQLAGRAARTQKAIERLDVVDEPRQPWELRLQINAAPRSGTLVAELDEAVVRRGDFTLGPVSLAVDYGERVVISGANGSGKSTLLGALLGDIEVTSGRARVGASVQIGRLTQRRNQLGAQQGTTLDAFLTSTGMTVSEARTLLAKFGIGAEHVGRPVASLSPGERTRLVLALFMAEQCNCLVLDEPTNHLDVAAIEQLEQALATFPGTVMLVSHDRQFLDGVRRTRTVELRGGHVVDDRTDAR